MSDEPQKKIDFKILTADNLISDKEAVLKKVNIDKKENLIIENKPETTKLYSVNDSPANANTLPQSSLSSSEHQSSNVSLLKKISSFLSTAKTEKAQDIDKPINIVYDQDLPENKQSLDIDKKDSHLFYQPTVKEIFKAATLAKTDETKEVSALPEEHVVKQSLVYRILIFFAIIISIGGISFYFLKDNPFINRLWNNNNDNDNNNFILPVINITYVDPFAATKTLTTTEATANNKNDQSTFSQLLPIINIVTISEQKITKDDSQDLNTSSVKNETSTTSSVTSVTQNTSSQPLLVVTSSETAVNNQLTSSPAKETKVVINNNIVDQNSNVDYLPASQKLDFTDNFKTLSISLDNNSLDTFIKTLKIESSKLKTLGSIYYLDFSVNNDQISVKPIVDYFIKPNKNMASLLEKFKANLTGNFALLFYYSHTRVYPILVLEIKDNATAKSFMDLWEKRGMSNDLQTIFLVDTKLSPLTQDFTKKFYQNIEYRTQNFEKNFILLWSVVKKYLIIAATDRKIDYLLSILSDY